jgi:hypothetical protein
MDGAAVPDHSWQAAEVDGRSALFDWNSPKRKALSV